MQLHGSIDLQRPRDLDTGKQLARRAKQHATFGADTRLAGWTVGAEVQASGPPLRHRGQHHRAGRLCAGQPVCQHPPCARDYTLLARIDNLADKDYQLAAPTPPQAARCTSV